MTASITTIAADVDITWLDETLPELDQPKVDRFVRIADGDIVIPRVPVVLPPEFCEALRLVPRLRLSWERKRPDLRDETLSGYEMSIASFLAHLDLGAQAITNVLVAFRDKERGCWHGRSYYRSTLSKALGSAAWHRRERREGAFRVAEDSPEGGPPGDGPPGGGSLGGPRGVGADPEDTQALLKRLNSAIVLADRSLRFTNVVKRGSAYVAFLDDLEINLGTVREMNAFVVPQAAIVEGTGINLVVPGSRRGKYWTPVVEAFLAVAHSQPAEFEAGLAEETRAHLARAINAIVARTSGFAGYVDMSCSDTVGEINTRVRNTLREEFLCRETQFPLPRFVLWGTDKRLYVHCGMLQVYLGTPAGGNERISTDRLQQGLRALRFTINFVKTGRAVLPGGPRDTSARWCISPPDFELDPGCYPQPGLNPAADGDSTSKPTFAVGDLVLWKAGGLSMFPGPLSIRGFSDDGQWAHFENGQRARVSELVPVTRGFEL